MTKRAQVVLEDIENVGKSPGGTTHTARKVQSKAMSFRQPRSDKSSGGHGQYIRRSPAALALADGAVFLGEAIGFERSADDPVVGEVVFNTAMYGYQEILTDPSYAGQIMTFTYPHLGNVGCNEEDVESGRIFVEGVVMRACAEEPSNFRATVSLDEYLRRARIMGISGVDTRALTTYIRDQGAQMGAFGVVRERSFREDVAALVDHARAKGSMVGKDYVQQVSCDEPYSWSAVPWELSRCAANIGHLPGTTAAPTVSEEAMSSRPHVIAVDCGIKHNILRLLVNSGFRVTVVPATYSAPEILALNPDALFLSNGPGDPATLGYIVSSVKQLVGRFPVFGICLGHQILAQVFGASTYKLKFGHRGGNHPVKNLHTGQVEITVQNHGFAVARESLSADVALTHLNLNDQTVEGLEVTDARAFSIQYHPEASPGPHDSQYLFRKFFENVVGYGGSPVLAAREEPR